MSARIAVFASGTGSNLDAIIRHLAAAGGAAAAPRVCLVASDKTDAGALAIAQRAGIASSVIRDPADPVAMRAMLRDQGITLVALAGYLRMIPAAISEEWRGQIINVHPALLPAFGGKGMYGGRVHAAVIAAGARLTGVTVHFVDAEYDHGPVIAQWPVPVFASDSAVTLASRVLRVEHWLYPRAVDAVAGGRVRLDGSGRVVGTCLSSTDATSFSLGTISPEK